MAEMRPEDVPDELVSAGRTAWREAFGQPVPAPDSMRKILAAFVGEFEQRLRKRAETAERELAELRERIGDERIEWAVRYGNGDIAYAGSEAQARIRAGVDLAIAAVVSRISGEWKAADGG